MKSLRDRVQGVLNSLVNARKISVKTQNKKNLARAYWLSEEQKTELNINFPKLQDSFSTLFILDKKRVSELESENESNKKQKTAFPQSSIPNAILSPEINNAFENLHKENALLRQRTSELEKQIAKMQQDFSVYKEQSEWKLNNSEWQIEQLKKQLFSTQNPTPPQATVSAPSSIPVETVVTKIFKLNTNATLWKPYHDSPTTSSYQNEKQNTHGKTFSS